MTRLDRVPPRELANPFHVDGSCNPAIGKLIIGYEQSTAFTK